MKTKIISLILAFGFLIAGESVKAADITPTTDPKEAATPSPSDAANALLNALLSVVDSTFPKSCQVASQNHNEANFWPDVTCCISLLQKNGKVPSTVVSLAKTFCSTICGQITCHCDQKPCSNAVFANTCGAFCCNTGWGSVDHCLAAYVPSAGHTCKKNFPICKTCTSTTSCQ